MDTATRPAEIGPRMTPPPQEPKRTSGGGVATSSAALAVSLVLCFGAAALGSQSGPGAWYASLNKPSWNPPNWVFAPVWTALYTIMAVSAWMVWKRVGLRGGLVPLAAFVIQLVLNAAWSWCFFGQHNPGLAFAEILVLWTAIAVTLFQFHRVSPVAAALLVPYLAWVSFAAVLNLAIWRLNPGGLP